MSPLGTGSFVTPPSSETRQWLVAAFVILNYKLLHAWYLEHGSLVFLFVPPRPELEGWLVAVRSFWIWQGLRGCEIWNMIPWRNMFVGHASNTWISMVVCCDFRSCWMWTCFIEWDVGTLLLWSCVCFGMPARSETWRWLVACLNNAGFEAGCIEWVVGNMIYLWTYISWHASKIWNSTVVCCGFRTFWIWTCPFGWDVGAWFLWRFVFLAMSSSLETWRLLVAIVGHSGSEHASLGEILKHGSFANLYFGAYLQDLKLDGGLMRFSIILDLTILHWVRCWNAISLEREKMGHAPKTWNSTVARCDFSLFCIRKCLLGR